MDERLEHLADEVTGGLADDPELRLDVRAELATHLERTAQAFQDEGQGADESIAQAVKVFGSPADLAGELLDANKRRMKLRALARLAIRTMLIPAALIIALWVGYANFVRLTSLSSMVRTIDSLAGGSLEELQNNSSEEFIKSIFSTIHGVGYAEGRLEKEITRSRIPKVKSGMNMPEITQTHPENKKYWGYYTSSQFYQGTFAQSVAEHGMKIDPDNGLYHYLLAHEYLSRALEPLSTKEYAKHKDGFKYTLKDSTSMEKGLREMAAGMACPYLRSYLFAVMKERSSRLSVPKTYEEYVQRTASAASEIFPHLASYRELARKSTFCAKYLIAHGQREEAKVPLFFCARFSEQLAKDPDSLIGIVTAKAISDIGADCSTPMADSIGKHDWAVQIRTTRDRFHQAIPKGDEALFDPSTSPQWKVIQQSGGVMAKIVMRVGVLDVPIQPQELAPSRYLDYWLVDRYSASFLLSLLLLALVALASFWGICYIAAGNARKSFILLLPTWKVLLRVFAYGILLPLGAYVIYTHIPGLSGREYNIGINSTRILIEHLVLWGILLLLPGILAGRYLKRRYVSLGIAGPCSQTVPAKRFSRVIGAFWLLTLVLASWLVISYPKIDPIVSVFLTALVLLTLLPGTTIIPLLKKPNAVYYGTLAGSLVPIYAISIILLTGITQPYLAYREAQLLTEDKLVFLHGNEVGFSPIENRVVEDIKGKLFSDMGK